MRAETRDTSKISETPVRSFKKRSYLIVLLNLCQPYYQWLIAIDFIVISSLLSFVMLSIIPFLVDPSSCSIFIQAVARPPSNGRTILLTVLAAST